LTNHRGSTRLYCMGILVAPLVAFLSLAVVFIKMYAAERGKAVKLEKMLVDSERMASLGKLVPPITHDLNTSIGVCVTAATYLADEAKTLGSRLSDGSLKKSELQRHAEVTRETAEILALNLGKAAELVAGFKRISINQSTATLEEFDLREYIDQIVISLGPKLRKTPHRVEIRCDRGIRMHSYPGALSQIVTNLIDNSLLHAFDEGFKGTLKIVAEAKDGWLTLTYGDDGRGMSDYARERAFTPFFTTRPQAGGTGLGLTIARDLAKNVMGGSVELESEPGKGTTFFLKVPLDAKANRQAGDTDGRARP